MGDSALDKRAKAFFSSFLTDYYASLALRTVKPPFVVIIVDVDDPELTQHFAKAEAEHDQTVPRVYAIYKGPTLVCAILPDGGVWVFGGFGGQRLPIHGDVSYGEARGTSE